MYMIKLKPLLESEDDINSELWDDWVEYIEFNSYDLPKEEIIKLCKKFNLNISKFLNVVFLLNDDTNKVYIIYDIKNQTFNHIKDIVDWIYNLDDFSMEDLLGYDVNKIYNGYIEGTLLELKESPGKLYHYTTDEKWEQIQSDGILKGSSGTGLTNRYSHGIFTSVDINEYADGMYGDVCLEIDVDKFKQDNNLHTVNLCYEPEIESCLLREQIKHALKLDNVEISPDTSGGMSYYTIILQHNIPVKYIRVI